MERKQVKRLARALVCAMIPGTALAQGYVMPLPGQPGYVPMPPVPAYDQQCLKPPQPMQTAPTATSPVLDDAQPSPDPYADSQRKLFFSNVELAAARIGSGAACGVITPGAGMQAMSDLLQYAQRQYGFSAEDQTMMDAYKAAFAYKNCALWLNDPNSVAWLRQMGQDAMDATQANVPFMSATPQYVPAPDPFPPMQNEIKSDDDSFSDDSDGD